MRVNTMVTLGASAAFGLLAVFLARSWINDAVSAQFAGNQARPLTLAAQNLQPVIETVPVIITETPLNFGDIIEPQLLRLVDMPEDMAPQGAYSDFDSLFAAAGERAIALSHMNANEPVLDYKIGGRGALSEIIGDGMRAASIRVNAVAGVGGFVLPGDHVDVILTRDTATGEQARKLTADILLQNVKVLGIDQNANVQSGGATVVKTVTLEVSNLQAQKLSLAMDIGTLTLTLRQEGLMAVEPVTRLTEHDLVSRARTQPKRQTVRMPKPKAPPPDQVAQVRIIRSGETESVNVRKEIMDRAAAADTLAGAKG